MLNFDLMRLLEGDRHRTDHLRWCAISARPCLAKQIVEGPAEERLDRGLGVGVSARDGSSRGSRGQRVDWGLVADYSSIRGAGEIPALLPRPARECGLSCIWSRDDVHRLPRRVWPHRPLHRPR